MGIGSKRQVVGLTREKTRPSVSASTRTKCSSVSSDKSDGSGLLKTTLFYSKRVDLMPSILPLKWSAKSSHMSFDVTMEDFLKSVLVKRAIVEKRNLWSFFLSVMSCEKWEVLDCFTALL